MGGRSLNQILGAKGDVWLYVFAPPLGVDPLSVHPVKGLSAAGVEPQSGGERRSSGSISRVFVSECVRADGPGCGAAGAGRRGGGGDGVYAAAASDASLPSKKITFSPFINWPKNTVPLGRPLGASRSPRQTVSVAATTAQLQFQLQLILPLAWRDRRGEKK